ncbi:PREDICTED: coiled-coil domain-containing protein 137 isoform X2 [Ipomoea nil]|uniref:coiled-coil domain-containing protein 137 isoform X2 n=1 Tax=Ipomoea nil TaxID=35883 RepID=UPI0009014E2D|nr:PREDICTED: coiled-coil domain-containing protein 137 isoform X2 [Ipomoea nil]
MGAKGRKRREKNYRESHKGNTRLPPPPDPSSVDALPSKLRKIMGLTGVQKKSSIINRAEGDGGDNKGNTKVSEVKRKTNGDKPAESNVPEMKNKKRKRKQVTDLRFESTEEFGGAGSKRKERRKQHLEERKKKRKKTRTEEHLDFPRHEQIKFGEVVDAPPKLAALPKMKALKTAHEASQERLRLKAVEAYRNRKGWTSRPGTQLPPPLTTSPSV